MVRCPRCGLSRPEMYGGRNRCGCCGLVYNVYRAAIQGYLDHLDFELLLRLATLPLSEAQERELWVG